MNEFIKSRRERDKLCDHFEREWLANNQFTIEQFVKQNPKQIGDESLAELIVVEIDLRHAHGDTLRKSEYIERFPTRLHTIESGFQRIKELEQTALVGTTFDPDGAQSRVETQTATTIPETVGGFQIIRALGTGAFGAVYKATEIASGKVFALKFPRRRSIFSLDELRQIQNEADAAKDLDHPAIVKSFGLRTADPFIFIVQQYIDGQTLAEIKLDDDRQVVSVVAKVADGLAYAHRAKLIHRDLKPSNIMIDGTGNPLIVDFGLAVHENVQRRLKGQRCGSPPYMSPEQVLGLTHQMDGRSDIWSLGVILYELLTRSRPFDGSNADEVFEEIKSRNEKPLRMLRPDLDHELQRICLRCLAKSIRDRYPTADELADDLNLWLQHEEAWNTRTFAPLVPRGLRPYEPQDADSFVQLLPGLRDRHGVPESILYWKRKIESFTELGGFAVGVILGPSGCGKSSFVRAGLIPRLDPQVVRQVYVEASRNHTEERLRDSLQSVFTEIPSDAGLTTIFDGLKNRSWSKDTRKVVIIIDQFEQWISTNSSLQESELVEALRHCDGSNLYCILLLRDEYWLGASRFLNTLGVGWSEAENIQRLDLLCKPHAQSVLYQLGRSLGKLPEDESQLTDANHTFLATVVEELANDDRVVCIELSTFSEMFRDREWSIKELSRIGGISGVGEMYLEELFGANSRLPHAIGIKHKIKLLLESLLPKAKDMPLNTRKCTVKQLKSAVGELGEVEFDRMLHWLVSDLRLITQTNTEWLDDDRNGKVSGSDADVYYRLTHDYLVPSLKSWLDRDNRVYWRGRAKLRLEELADLWSLKKESRYLPSLFDFLRIKFATFGTRSIRLTQVHHRFMKAAALWHGRRLGVASVLALVLFAVFAQIHRTRVKRIEATVAVQRYLDSGVQDVESHLDGLQKFSPPSYVESALKSGYEIETEKTHRIDIALNLIGDVDEVRLERIVAAFSDVSDSECRFAIGQMANSAATSCAVLKRRTDPLEQSSRNNFETVRIAAALLYLNDAAYAEQIYANQKDPTIGTLLTHAIVNLFPDSNRLLKVVTGEVASPDLLCGLLVAAGNYPIESWSPEEQSGWRSLLHQHYAKNQDSGVHGACAYLLQRWRLGLPNLPATKSPREGFEWWVIEVLPGIKTTFVRVPGRNFTRMQEKILSPKVDQYFPPGKDSVTSEFWLADCELQFRLFSEWLKEASPIASDRIMVPGALHQSLEQRMRTGRRSKALFDQAGFDLPVCVISHSEASEFIDWLNKREVFAEGNLEFSLPTADEFYVACLGNAVTSQYFGDHSTDHLQDRYAVLASSLEATDELFPPDAAMIQFPRTRAPNRLGLFDMNGNVGEFLKKTERELAVSAEPRSLFAGGTLLDEENCSPGMLGNCSPHLLTLPCLGFRIAIRKKEQGLN